MVSPKTTKGESMKGSMCAAFLGSLIAAVVCADAPLDTNSDTDVIVILRDQIPAVPATRDLRAARIAALATSRAPIMAELQRVQARKIRPFNMINAVAATVSKTEAAQLSAHPLVQAVVPDSIIRLPKSLHAAASAVSTRGSGSEVAGSGALCNTLEPEALQL